MTQHKHQMSQAYFYMPKHDLRISGINSDYLEVITPNKIRSHGQLSHILCNFFNIFSNWGNNNDDSSSDENAIVRQHLNSIDLEAKTLRDLENCANTAREVGACGQIKWINKTDEA